MQLSHFKKPILLDVYFCFVSSHNSFTFNFSSLAFPSPSECIVLLSTPVLAAPSRILMLRFNARSVCAAPQGVYGPFFLLLAARAVREGNPYSYGTKSSTEHFALLHMPGSSSSSTLLLAWEDPAELVSVLVRLLTLLTNLLLSKEGV